jgi:hypothetical protein
VESDYHIAFAALIAQPEPLLDSPNQCGHIEIGRGLSDLQRSHTFLLPNVSHGCVISANRFLLASLHLQRKCHSERSGADSLANRPAESKNSCAARTSQPSTGVLSIFFQFF